MWAKKMLEYVLFYHPVRVDGCGDVKVALVKYQTAKGLSFLSARLSNARIVKNRLVNS